MGTSLGTARFNVSGRGRSSSYVGAAVERRGRALLSHDVVTVTLDWLLERYFAPTVIKIDVEGLELEVLKGGSKVFAQARPCVLCEVQEQNAKAVTSLFHDAGYELFDLGAAPPRRPPSLASWNTAAVHRQSPIPRLSA